MAAGLMARFAERSGLSPAGRPARRYLWTDAFAVCNFLGLARSAGAPGCRELAVRLVGQVHHVLGQHRPDDPRRGWLSGLAGDEAEAHPTRGGLRIGKELPERGPHDPFDPDLEWERDGQYFHYLTRWMHALDQLTLHTGDPAGNLWARELAETAHAAFTCAPAPGAPRRMFWKMSIDLTRPLVPSMGQHDPLDGLITCMQLRAHRPPSAPGPDLAREIADFADIAVRGDWRTDDPLGLGGLLADAHRIEQLARGGAADRRLLGPLLGAAAPGLGAWLRRRPLDRGVEERLAFRELGLSIGLHAVARMWAALQHDPGPLDEPAVRSSLEALSRHLPLIDAIESFWSDAGHRQAAGWLAHADINEVMLATSLEPTGFLTFG